MNGEDLVIEITRIPRSLMTELHKFAEKEKNMTVQEWSQWRGWFTLNELKSTLGKMYPQTFRAIAEAATVRYSSLSADKRF